MARIPIDVASELLIVWRQIQSTTDLLSKNLEIHDEMRQRIQASLVLVDSARKAFEKGGLDGSSVLDFSMDTRRQDHLKTELTLADRHITETRDHITKQVAIIDRLDRDGHDSTLAKELLAILHKTLQMHEDHREHIMREFDA